jgi:hypothetical protein
LLVTEYLLTSVLIKLNKELSYLFFLSKNTKKDYGNKKLFLTFRKNKIEGKHLITFIFSKYMTDDNSGFHWLYSDIHCQY